MRHKSVLIEEVLRGLQLRPGDVVVDATLGSGGHSLEILKHIGPKGRLIGLDQDPAALERSRERLKAYGSQISWHLENFEHIDRVLDGLNISRVDAVILDVGFSSDQIEDTSRGFSFEREGPLDMRMNPDFETTASDLINQMNEKDLADLFWKYGEERRSRRIAKTIVERRVHQPITTTTELVATIEAALGIKRRIGRPAYRPRIHPATQVFQALRIAVNRELEVLEQSLPKFWKYLAPKRRMAVISFHSLEDRIVKRQFRAWLDSDQAVLVTKKPVIAQEQERQDNPRSRSAKLRVAEKIV